MKPKSIWLGRIALTLMTFMGGNAATPACATPPDTSASCADWNTEGFFEIASVAEVTACLEEGADPKARDVKGRIPLILAATHTQYPAVITALLEAGADLRAVGRGGGTSLHLAAENNHNPEVIEALLEAGANARARAHGKHGLTP